MQCSTNLEELVANAMLKWGLTRAEMTKAYKGGDDEGGTAQASAGIPGGADEEEVPATQPYPEEVLMVPEGEGTPEAVEPLAIREQAAVDQAEEQEDSDEDSNSDWGAAKFVAGALAADPNMLPGDIADLEDRAAGRTSKHFGVPKLPVLTLPSFPPL